MENEMKYASPEMGSHEELYTSLTTFKKKSKLASISEPGNGTSGIIHTSLSWCSLQQTVRVSTT